MIHLIFIRFFSSKTRENSLRTLQALLSQKYLSDFISNRVESLTEQLITSLRRGSESEGKLAAIVTSLVFVQLGQPDDDLFIKFRDAILPTLRDETKPLSIRKNVGRLNSNFIYLYSSFSMHKLLVLSVLLLPKIYRQQMNY